MVRKIIENGTPRIDRTGVGTLALFGEQLRFNLVEGSLPLITTKYLPWKIIYKELLWFISGSTNSNILEDEGVNIWKGYGFQWRHSGAFYRGFDVDYTNQGIDQLSNVIDGLKTDPYSRRHVVNSWNPTDLPKMTLPPCHYSFQFFVHDDDKGRKMLSCLVSMRSSDVGLGLPFNIASYAMLTHMIAHVLGYYPYELVMSLGDTHVYQNHVAGLNTLCSRVPSRQPTFNISGNVSVITDFTIDDVDVTGYHPQGKIKMRMAV
ncbi:UNVERIFIED_CONTAM: hypothetical protein GTU68_063821 [Idotea baltica]|nr:hypothetical protein [Idotea baltica]